MPLKVACNYDSATCLLGVGILMAVGQQFVKEDGKDALVVNGDPTTCIIIPSTVSASSKVFKIEGKAVARYTDACGAGLVTGGSSFIFSD